MSEPPLEIKPPTPEMTAERPTKIDDLWGAVKVGERTLYIGTHTVGKDGNLDERLVITENREQINTQERATHEGNLSKTNILDLSDTGITELDIVSVDLKGMSLDSTHRLGKGREYFVRIEGTSPVEMRGGSVVDEESRNYSLTLDRFLEPFRVNPQQPMVELIEANEGESHVGLLLRNEENPERAQLLFFRADPSAEQIVTNNRVGSWAAAHSTLHEVVELLRQDFGRETNAPLKFLGMTRKYKGATRPLERDLMELQAIAESFDASKSASAIGRLRIGYGAAQRVSEDSAARLVHKSQKGEVTEAPVSPNESDMEVEQNILKEIATFKEIMEDPAESKKDNSNPKLTDSIREIVTTAEWLPQRVEDPQVTLRIISRLEELLGEYPSFFGERLTDYRDSYENSLSQVIVETGVKEALRNKNFDILKRWYTPERVYHYTQASHFIRSVYEMRKETNDMSIISGAADTLRTLADNYEKHHYGIPIWVRNYHFTDSHAMYPLVRAAKEAADELQGFRPTGEVLSFPDKVYYIAAKALLPTVISRPFLPDARMADKKELPFAIETMIAAFPTFSEAVGVHLMLQGRVMPGAFVYMIGRFGSLLQEFAHIRNGPNKVKKPVVSVSTSVNTKNNLELNEAAPSRPEQLGQIAKENKSSRRD